MQCHPRVRSAAMFLDLFNYKNVSILLLPRPQPGSLAGWWWGWGRGVGVGTCGGDSRGTHYTFRADTITSGLV